MADNQDYFHSPQAGWWGVPQQYMDIFYKSGPFQDPAQQQQVSDAMNLFKTTFKNLTGQDATPDQIGQFAQGALYNSWIAPGELTYSDNSNLANNYVQNQFSPQIASYNQQQQTNQLQNTQQMIQDLVSKQTAAQAADLTNPNSPTYKSFAGLMNNMGITPDSGAFQEGIGGQLGSNAASAINAALGGVSMPALSGIQGMTNFPLQFASGNSNLGHFNEVSDFSLQALYDQLAARDAAPSGLDKGLGYGAAFLNGAGNAAIGSSALMNSTSYVCKELIKRGLISESDMDDFHVHIMPAMFKKGRAFWKYAMDGRALVDSANAVGLKWEFFKPMLFDHVMQKNDPCKAVDQYAKACKMIAWTTDPALWDERVFRTSFWDSLPFLPRLFCYKPFLEALWKCVRFKFAFLMDRPEVSRGA